MNVYLFRRVDKENIFGRVESFAIGQGKNIDEARKDAKIDRGWERVFDIDVSPHTFAVIHKPK